jgi:hypothetical protein
VFTSAAKLALIVLVPAILFTLLVGDELGGDRGPVPADEDRGRGGRDLRPYVPGLCPA